jgi:hypothetical protein
VACTLYLYIFFYFLLLLKQYLALWKEQNVFLFIISRRNVEGQTTLKTDLSLHDEIILNELLEWICVCVCVYWVDMEQAGDNWRDFLNTVMNVWFL